MKHIRIATAILLIAVLLVSSALASELTEYNGPAWTFGVNLAELNENLLRVVDADSPLTAEDVPSKLVTLKTRHNNEAGANDNGGIYKASNAKIQLCETAELALVSMFAAAENQGVILYVRQGYRSYEDMAKRYEAAVAKGNTAGVAKPGQSDYQTGMAATVVGKEWRTKELTSEFSASTESQWLQQNAARFGFIIPQSAEPWHVRYVGATVALYMSANNMDLASFKQALTTAKEEFTSIGGDFDAAMASMVLPEGAVILDEVGPDGDHEITIFHD